MRRVTVCGLLVWLLAAGVLRAEEPPPVELVRDLTPPSLDVPAAKADSSERLASAPGSLAPTAPNEAGFYARVDYLLGRPRSDNQDYAIRNGTGGLAVTGPVESLGYRLGNGFTAELGYRFGSRGLDLDATIGYTYFAASGAENLAAGAGAVLFPTITRPGLTDRVLSAAADTSLNLNLYDLQFTRRFLVDDHLALRGYGGLRFADIRQTFTARYNGLDARSATVNTRSRFDGFGPTLGGEAVVAANRGIHLYLRAGGGLLVGDSVNSWVETNDNGNSPYVNAPYQMHKVVPFANVGVGLGWQYRTVSLRFGYDVTEWFGATERLRLSNDVAQGALSTRSGNIGIDGFFVQCSLTY